ncbi:MAG: EAL domain-containing protein [Betaproteobacteria bacterium]
MTAPTIRILLTEDVPADAELQLRELKRAGLHVAHRIVDAEDSFQRALREFSPDIILSDFSMPGFDGMAALALARELAPETPFVFVSGTIGEEYAIRALKNGATDYVLKDNLVRLPAAVERALAEARQRREKRRTEVELEIARERLTSIFTSLPDAIWSMDAETRRYLYVSPASKAIFGFSPEELLADPGLQTELVYANDRPLVAQAWHRLELDGEFDVDYRIVRPESAVRWINDRARVIRGTKGIRQRVDGLARDITPAVEARARVERLSRIREVLGALNAAIVRIRDRQALFAEFCRIAVELGHFSYVRLVERDPRTSRLHLAVTGDVGADAFGRMIDAHNADPAAARGLLASALRTGRIVVSNDAANDERAVLRDWYASAGVRSVAYLPFRVEGAVAGAVVLNAAERAYFDAEEARLLEDLSGNLGFALELMAKQDRIAFLALYDPLTELPNRTLFHERLTQAIEAGRRSGASLALALIDIERFKAINDTFGRQAGDSVLKAVAGRLREAAGDIDRVARLGSDAFALVFLAISSAEEVRRRLQAGSHLFAAPLPVGEREVRLAAKVGIAVHPDDGADADALLRNAEAALKRAKETGERYMFYAPAINARVSEQLELEHRLREAVERREFFLHFQPKLELATRRLVGMEALLRWKGPGGVPMPPAKFVPVLEQTGLILEAGEQAISSASAAYRLWQERGLDPPRIAVNISAIQLRRNSFVADVLSALGAAASDGGGIDLEVTESLLMTDVEASIAKLKALRDAGMRISLDDFGTGYSSLAYLSRLPVDAVKIDRGFVRGMSESAGDASIVAAIISLAHSLRLKVVAEGVESEAQARILSELGCDQAQGYLFSPPVPAARIEALLKTL